MGPALALLMTVAATPKLAATEWTTARVEPDLASFFAGELARALRANGVGVVTATEMRELLGLERQRQLLGCDDATRGSCLAELGGALGCEGLLRGSVARLDGSLRANLSVLSTADGRTLAETVVEASTEKEFVAHLEAAASRLAAPLLLRSRPPELAASAAPHSRAWIPAVAGGVVAAGGGLLLGLGFRNSALLDTELQQHGLTDTATGLARDGKLLQALGWVGLGVGAASLLTAGAMALFGWDAPVAPVVLWTPQGASLTFAGRWP